MPKPKPSDYVVPPEDIMRATVGIFGHEAWASSDEDIVRAVIRILGFKTVAVANDPEPMPPLFPKT